MFQIIDSEGTDLDQMQLSMMFKTYEAACEAALQTSDVVKEAYLRLSNLSLSPSEIYHALTDVSQLTCISEHVPIVMSIDDKTLLEQLELVPPQAQILKIA